MKLLKLLLLNIFICIISIHASAFTSEVTYRSNTSFNTGQKPTIIPSVAIISYCNLKLIAAFYFGGIFGAAIGLFAGGIVAGGGSIRVVYECDEEMFTS